MAGYYDRRMAAIFKLVVTGVVLSALISCTSSTSSGDLWSRSYIAPIERVVDAVIDALEDEGYLVDSDLEKGRITAEPSRSVSGQRSSLVIEVVEKNGKVLVDVQTRAGASDSMPRGSRNETAIIEFFHELDLRLQGLKD